MIRFFRNLRLDSISFWAGFVASTLFWLLLRILRPALRKGWQFLKTTVQSARQGLLTNTEQRHRVDTIKHVQGLHLAAPLFSLDEVLITPRLMAPPVIVDPDVPPPYEDTINTTIPFAPDWPELAAVYDTNSLDVFDVLGGSSNIAIIGKPGIGKTTILAYIATKIARQDPEAEAFQNTIPVFLHVEELEFPEDDETEVLDVVIRAVSARASTLTQPRLSELLHTSFEMGKVLLLLDGLDELAPEVMRVRVEYLRELIEAYPDNQIIVSADVHQINGLPGLGFATIPVAPWGKINQAKFIQRWGDLWTQFIIPDPDPEDYIDPLLLNGWLINLDPVSTPFDLTLKVWAAYAGDSRGPSDIDGIEAFIQRLYVGLPKARITLELIASEILQIMDPGFTENQALDWIRKGGVEELIPETEEMVRETEAIVPEVDEIVPEKSETKIEPIKRNIIFRILPELIQQGLIHSLPNKKFYFVHPIISGYLAGSTINQQTRNKVFTQPRWNMKNIACNYMARHRSVGDEVRRLLSITDDLLKRDQLTTGQWLKYLPRDLSERKMILQQLTNDLQNESLTMMLRARILSALAASGDPGVPTLFRHLLNSPHSNVRQLAVLGCGYLGDLKSVADLIPLLGDILNVAQAACMALVNIGTKPALEAVAKVLIQGDEQIRRSAAESFANHQQEGFPILKDGSTVEDLLTRRAVIYGLRRVQQTWAREILEELQIEDEQWVVKDAAAQAVVQLNTPDPAIPQSQPPLEDLPWLVAFASDRDLGISSGAPARDMLKLALNEGTDDEKLAALGQVRLRGEFEVFPAIYDILYGDNPELQEAAFYTIWHIASSGYEIPTPGKFGFG